MTEPVTVEQVKAARWAFKLHMSFDDHHVMAHQCIPVPELMLRSVSAKNKRFKGEAGRFLIVGQHEFPVAELQAAVDAVNALRAGGR